MGLVLFTVSGCSRCEAVKKFLRERSIAFEERDALGEGKAAFADFYRAHRQSIVRGREGVEFPVLGDGEAVRQGLGPVLAYLQGGAGLESFFRRAESPRGWVSGIDISAGEVRAAADFFAVLEFLKRAGQKLEIATDGRNAALLEELFRRGLADRVVMRLHGPPEVHREAVGGKTGIAEIEAAMALACRFPEYRFETTVVSSPSSEPAPGGLRPLAPEEVAATARWLKEVTGSHRQPYVLVPCPAPSAAQHPSPPAPAPASLVRHRSAARTFQVLTEVARSSE